MQELIKIDFDNDTPVVSARTLHEFLEVDTDFRHWFPRMCEYGFTEGVDFNSVKIDRVQNEGNRLVTRKVDDAALSIDMAKEVCMIQRTERGKQARQYFIETEKKWKNSAKPMTQLEIIAAQAQALVDHERRMNAIEDSVKTMDNKLTGVVDTFKTPLSESDAWQEETRRTVTKLVQDNKLSYQAYWADLYERLEVRAGVNLETRKKRLKERLAKQGASKRVIENASKLLVISRDKKLVEIFNSILREEKAKYVLLNGGQTA